MRLHEAFEKCIALTSVENSGRSFWGAHQAFFKQLLNSIKCRFAIAEAEGALARGESVVIGLLSTGMHPSSLGHMPCPPSQLPLATFECWVRVVSAGEAKANEAAERAGRAGEELESEVSTPHEIARDMIERHLPTEHRDGQHVPQAEEYRRSLLRELDAIRMPGNALDLLISVRAIR